MTDRRNDPTRRMNGGRAVAEMLNAMAAPHPGHSGLQRLPRRWRARSGMIQTLTEACGALAPTLGPRDRRPGVVDATLDPGASNL